MKKVNIMKNLLFTLALVVFITSCADDSKNKYDLVYDQLNSLYDSSKYNEAVVLLDDLIINDSTEHLLYYYRGLALEQQRKFEISLDSSYQSDVVFNENFGTRIVADYDKAISLLQYQIYELENDSLFNIYTDILFLKANNAGGLLNNWKYEIDTYTFLIEDTNISESDPEFYGTCLHMRGYAKFKGSSKLSDEDYCIVAKDAFNDILLGDTFLADSDKKATKYTIPEFCD